MKHKWRMYYKLLRAVDLTDETEVEGTQVE